MFTRPSLKSVRRGLAGLLTIFAVSGSPLLAVAITLTPPQPSNLALWLRADAGVTTDIDGFVSQWDDQSGMGNHVAQASGPLQPTLVTGVTYSNQTADPFSVIRFDGVDLLSRSSSLSSLPRNLTPGGTVFVVMRLADTEVLNPGGTLMAFGVDNNNRFSMGLLTGTPGTINPRLRVNGVSTGTTSSSVDPQENIYYVATAVWNGPGTGALTAHVLNPNGTLTTDAQGAIGSNTTAFAAPTKLYVGALGFGVTNQLNGDIAELLIYNTGLGTSDQSIVRTYLGQKYGVIPVFPPGDFNHDSFVDAADYVVWRKGTDVPSTPENYELWRANFGSAPGAGTSLGETSAVPEPASFGLLLCVVVSFLGVRRPRRGRSNT